MILLFSVLFSIGCGSGSSSATNNNNGGTNVGTAQGVYQGTAANGDFFETIVLPNDKAYAVYGLNSGGVFTVYGMMTGQGASNNGSYTANLKDFDYTGTGITATLTASYVAGSTLNGTVSEGGASLSFTGTAIPSSLFNYNTPADMANITGNWTGDSLEGAYSNVNVTSGGTITGSSGGCSFTGTVTPSNAKNFYTVSLSFGPSPCLAPNQTAQGIAVTYLLQDGVTRQVVVGGTTSGGYGSAFVATR